MQYEPQRWLEDYNRDGYVVVEDVIDADTIALLRGEIEAITNNLDKLSDRLRSHISMERDYAADHKEHNELSLEEIGNAVRNIMELPKFSRELAQFIVHEPLLEILQTLFESPEFHFHNYKCIIKAPKVSSIFRWHRDLPYLQHTGPNLITAMVCLDPMTKENGATVVLPGSHRLVADDEVRPGDVEIKDEELPDIEHVTVECPAGSAVLFHVNIIHGGGANRSPIPRRNVIGIWAGPDTYPVKGVRFAYQGLYPRSQDPAKRKQARMTFPEVYAPQTV